MGWLAIVNIANCNSAAESFPWAGNARSSTKSLDRHYQNDIDTYQQTTRSHTVPEGLGTSAQHQCDIKSAQQQCLAKSAQHQCDTKSAELTARANPQSITAGTNQLAITAAYKHLEHRRRNNSSHHHHQHRLARHALPAPTPSASARSEAHITSRC